MKINPALVRLPLTFGAASALLTSMAFIVFFYLDLQPWRNLLSFILDIILTGAFVFAVIREFKNRNGELRFYHGMTLGMALYIVSALGFALVQGLFISLIEPGFVDTYIELSKQDMIARKVLLSETFGEEGYAQNLAALDQTTAFQIVRDTFVKKLPVGLILTPAISVILRTPQR